MKAILGTGSWPPDNVARASMVAMMAGADFIKTSTGKEPVNAVLPSAVVMARMILTMKCAPERRRLQAAGHPCRKQGPRLDDLMKKSGRSLAEAACSFGASSC